MTRLLREKIRLDAGDGLNAVRLLCALGEPIDHEHFVAALHLYLGAPYPNQRDILIALVNIASSGADAAMRSSIEEGVAQLALIEVRGSGYDPTAFLALPLLFWKLFERSSDAATTVFRLGIVAICGAGRESRPADGLATLGGLLRATPKHLIRAAMSMPSEEPSATILTFLTAVLGIEERP